MISARAKRFGPVLALDGMTFTVHQEQVAGFVEPTAADTVRERVDGLGLGADDYLLKPSDFAEVVARVRAWPPLQPNETEDAYPNRPRAYLPPPSW